MFPKQVKMIALCVFALVAVFVLAPGLVQAANVEGRITAISLAHGTVTISPGAGHAVMVKVVRGTQIELNGRETTLSALRVGDHGDADYNATTHVASGIDATR
jgi:hypothetical protein